MVALITHRFAQALHLSDAHANLFTLPFWQLPDITEPAGPENGHVWHCHDI
jgi:hypothetical protein